MLTTTVRLSVGITQPLPLPQNLPESHCNIPLPTPPSWAPEPAHCCFVPESVNYFCAHTDAGMGPVQCTSISAGGTMLPQCLRGSALTTHALALMAGLTSTHTGAPGLRVCEHARGTERLPAQQTERLSRHKHGALFSSVMSGSESHPAAPSPRLHRFHVFSQPDGAAKAGLL